MPSGVLVLAPGEDGEADLVASRLTDHGARVSWLDTAWFPARATVDAELGPAGWHGSITSPDGTIDLAGIGAVFYRQSQPFAFPAGLSSAEERFARVEGRFGLGGLLASLPARWVPGTPGAVADAEYKPVQLATAARCGLATAPTKLTNHPKTARRFVEEQEGGAVYKALMHKVIADDGDVRLIYTTPVPADAIDERVALTMHQFQANLTDRKHADLRVVATRRQVIAVAIRTSDPAAQQDFRVAYHTLTYEPADVPADVVSGCRRYLTVLGLRLGVFDFCLTDDGWVFLECGPGSQWAWLQEATGVSIAELVTDALIGEP